MAARMTLHEMAKELNRPMVLLAQWQQRFELHAFDGAGYGAAYFAFLRKLLHLRVLGIPEPLLLDLWKVEKHLLQLLHLDVTGSPTWYLDECAKSGHLDRRLLLTHHDLGPGFVHNRLQPHLDFSAAPRSLFSGKEIGDDALRVLGRYRDLYSEIQTRAYAEAPRLRDALHWLHRLQPLPGDEP